MRAEKQLSVFLENQPGTLAAMCDQLAKSEINILAMSVGDTADYAVVRLLVDKAEEAIHLLGEAGTLVVENDVLVVDLPNQIGALGELAGKLRDAGINIEYAYGTTGEKQSSAALVMRVRDIEKAMDVLS